MLPVSALNTVYTIKSYEKQLWRNLASANLKLLVTWGDTPASVLGSFAFQKAWVGVWESAFKKGKKGALGTEGNATSFSMLPA